MLDMNINRVYHELTGVNYMRDITLDSDFWSLVLGNNTIRIETALDGSASLSSVRSTWTDRFY